MDNLILGFQRFISSGWFFLFVLISVPTWIRALVALFPFYVKAVWWWFWEIKLDGIDYVKNGNIKVYGLILFSLNKLFLIHYKYFCDFLFMPILQIKRRYSGEGYIYFEYDFKTIDSSRFFSKTEEDLAKERERELDQIGITEEVHCTINSDPSHLDKESRERIVDERYRSFCESGDTYLLEGLSFDEIEEASLRCRAKLSVDCKSKQYKNFWNPPSCNSEALTN